MATVILLLSRFFLAYGLDPSKPIKQYTSVSWTVKNGLPVNGVECVYQSGKGYLWIGTQEGLLCFDGKRFKTFIKSNTPVMGSNLINGIDGDANGMIWVGTHKGLLRIEGSEIDLLDERDGLAHSMVKDVMSASDGTIWTVTPGRGVNHVFVDRHSLVDRIESFTQEDGLSTDVVWCVEEGADGTVWFGTSEGLNCYRDGQFSRFDKPDDLPNKCIRSLHYAPETGSLWIGTEQGLSCLKEGKFTNYTVEDGLSSGFILALARDQDGNIWIGTNGGGLNRLSQGVIAHVRDGFRPGGDMIRGLCVDREGCLWVAAYGTGLTCLKDENFITYSTDFGLPNLSTQAVYEDNNGTLWVGTFKGLCRLGEEGFTVMSTADGLSGDMVNSLAEDRDGALWVGTYGKGITRIHDGKCDYINVSHGLSLDFIRSLCMDNDGAMWIGTARGLNRYTDGEIETFGREDGLATTSIFGICSGRDGTVWIGTSGGLHYYREGKITRFDKAQSLTSGPVYALYEDAEDTLWIGTYEEGLHRLKDGRISKLTSREGLFDDKAYQILEDNSGNLWMSCNRGVYRMSKRDFELCVSGRIPKVKCVSYGTSDGMRCSETNGGFQPAGVKGHDGKMWFPTMEGVVRVDPENLLPQKAPPPAIIERVTFDYSEKTVIDSMVIPAGTGRIEIDYTVISLKSPSNIRMKHKLEGYDEDWIEAGEDRKASYALLPPGDYRFVVMAGNREGSWNSQAASIDFAMEAYFYQTPYFYVLLILVLASTLFCLHRARIRRLEKIRRMLSERVEEALELEHRKEMRYRSLFENNLAGVAVTRLDGRIVDSNNSFASIYGFDAKENVLGRNVLEFYVNPDDRAEMLRQVKRGEIYVNYDCPAKKKDGTLMHVMLSIQLVPGENGEKPVLESTVIDITEYKLAEENIKSSLREKEVLLRELHHRTKNNMHVITSLLELQSLSSTDEQVRKIIKDSIERINSMALVHQKLYTSDDLSRIDFADYIKDLAFTVLKSYSIERGLVDLHLDVEPISVRIDTAIPCGLILNELISNALEHAFPDGREGAIHVGLKRDAENRITLQVRDNGIGCAEPMDVDQLKSLGFRLISNLARFQLKGEMRIETHEGTSIEIQFKEKEPFAQSQSSGYKLN